MRARLPAYKRMLDESPRPSSPSGGTFGPTDGAPPSSSTMTRAPEPKSLDLIGVALASPGGGETWRGGSVCRCVAPSPLPPLRGLLQATEEELQKLGANKSQAEGGGGMMIPLLIGIVAIIAYFLYSKQ